MVGKGDVIGYNSGRGFRDVVLQDLLKMYVERAPVELVKMPSRRVTKVAVADTSDLAAWSVAKEIIQGNLKKLKQGPVEGKIVKPLYLFLDREVLLYAKLRGLKFKKSKVKKDKIVEFIEELEKKHPELKHAVVQSYLKLG